MIKTQRIIAESEELIEVRNNIHVDLIARKGRELLEERQQVLQVAREKAKAGITPNQKNTLQLKLLQKTLRNRIVLKDLNEFREDQGAIIINNLQ